MKENRGIVMNIQKALLIFITDGVGTSKQLAEFYDTFHEDIEF